MIATVLVNSFTWDADADKVPFMAGFAGAVAWAIGLPTLVIVLTDAVLATGFAIADGVMIRGTGLARLVLSLRLFFILPSLSFSASDAWESLE